jgi:hypothetical protein
MRATCLLAGTALWCSFVACGPEGTTRSNCSGGKCEKGEDCIEFTGFDGSSFYTCGIPCKGDDETCPDGMECVHEADGPTECDELAE